MPSIGRLEDITTSSLCASILRLCAPTLESLTWRSGLSRSDTFTFADDGPDSSLPFLCLRDLSLSYMRFRDSSILNALLQNGLRVLEVDTERDSISVDFFQKRGRISSLETFAWSTSRIPASHSLEFLRANTQLSKLRLQHSAPEELLGILLPILSTSFSNLRSLSLAWESTSIPESALELISTLKTLEQIHLSAGCQFGWKYDWMIDHESMQKHLKKLPCLRKIALSRDSYYNGFVNEPWPPAGYYYSRKYLAAQDAPVNPTERDAVWEQMHRKRMLDEAYDYVTEMPNLEWLYIGEYCLAFEERSSAGKEPYFLCEDLEWLYIGEYCLAFEERSSAGKEPYFLCEERDSCYTLLRRMFGGAPFC